MKSPASLFKGLFNPSGTVSPDRALRKLYLTLFLRGHAARRQQEKNRPSSVWRRLGVLLLVYALFGLFARSLSGAGLFPLTVFLHSMSFVLLGLFVAGSTGEVLFNKEESEILLHRPVSAESVLKAKVSVLLQVGLWLVGALNLAGFFVGAGMAESSWLFIPVHALSMLLEALFCIGVIVLSYQLCLKYFGRERLDNLMTGVQIFMAIIIVLAGQVMPRLLAGLGGHLVLDAQHWWLVFFPPVWFASLDQGLAGTGGSSFLLLALVGVLVTSLVLWLAFGLLARDYGAGLRSLQETVSNKSIRHGGRWSLSSLLEYPPLSWWLRDRVARSSFLLVTAYLSRDREVKLRVFPGLAPMVVMPVVMLMNVRNGASSSLAVSFMVAFCGTYVGMLPFMALGMLRFSQHWHAAEIFRVAPLLGPGELCHGARRAVLLLLTAPTLALMLAGMLVIRSDWQVLWLLLPGALMLPVCSLLPGLFHEFVPFSEPADQTQSSSRMLVMLLGTLGALLLAGMALLAWSLGLFVWFIVLEVIVMSVAHGLLRRRVSLQSWGASF